METAMKTMTDKKRGWGLLSLGLDAFAGLGLEVVYAFLLEPLLYGASMEGWNTWQTIVHWIITCISWGLVAAWVLRTGEKKYGLKLFSELDEGTRVEIRIPRILESEYEAKD